MNIRFVCMYRDDYEKKDHNLVHNVCKVRFTDERKNLKGVKVDFQRFYQKMECTRQTHIIHITITLLCLNIFSSNRSMQKKIDEAITWKAFISIDNKKNYLHGCLNPFHTVANQSDACLLVA
jgi:hypothetical protein